MAHPPGVEPIRQNGKPHGGSPPENGKGGKFDDLLEEVVGRLRGEGFSLPPGTYAARNFYAGRYPPPESGVRPLNVAIALARDADEQGKPLLVPSPRAKATWRKAP